MNIPDYISPIVAYRSWVLNDDGLWSHNKQPWKPKEAMVATCDDAKNKFYMKPPAVKDVNGWVRTPAGRYVDINQSEPMTEAEARWFHLNHTDHKSPVEDCTCGIYAAKTFDQLVENRYVRKGIHGEVLLWGVIFEHKLGMRAQYGYPKNFVIPMDELPTHFGITRDRLEYLIQFDVDIFLTANRFEDEDSQVRVPLWTKADGWIEEGRDYLMSVSQHYHGMNRRDRDSLLKRGDRVAIIGKGIGTVMQVIDRPEAFVYVEMGTRTVFKLRRGHVLWDERNRRWECSRSWTEMCQAAGVVRHAMRPPAKNDPADVMRIRQILNYRVQGS